MLTLYRISDWAQGAGVAPAASGQKAKLAGVEDKIVPLRNYIDVFGADGLWVIADRCSDATVARILGVFPREDRIFRTSFGSGAFSFLYAVRLVVESQDVPDWMPVHLVEDDYVWLPGPATREALGEGLAISHYATLYAHPDKLRVEATVCRATPRWMWRETASTTMTFAARKETLREDMPVFLEHCRTGYPFDHDMFLELGRRGRRLVHPVPGLATHAELAWLSPCVDWQAVVDRYRAPGAPGAPDPKNNPAPSQAMA